MSNTEVIACSVELNVRDGVPEWINLLPVGDVLAVDGRRWRVADAEAIVTLSRPGGPAGLLVDYDHGADQGGSSEAAGWIRDLAVRGKFICARVEWTQDGAARLQKKSYRFISPVFSATPNGTVRRILRAGLTNRPALPQLGTLASEETRMEQLRKALLDELGLADSTDDETVLAEFRNHLAGARPDPRRFVPIDQVRQLVQETHARHAEVDQSRVTAKVDAAMCAGKLQPARREWAIELCAIDEAAFDEFVAKTVPIIRPGVDPRFSGAPKSWTEAVAGASVDVVCSQLGISVEALSAELNRGIAE